MKKLIALFALISTLLAAAHMPRRRSLRKTLKKCSAQSKRKYRRAQSTKKR